RTQLVILYGKTGRDLAAIRLAEGEPQGAPPLLGAALVRLLSSPAGRAESQAAAFSFEPSIQLARSRVAGLKTLSELNDSAGAGIRPTLLASLMESSAKLEQYDRAIAIERVRAAEAAKPEEKIAIEKRLAEIVAAEKARQLRLALLTRIDRSNATESIYAAHVLGN